MNKKNLIVFVVIAVLAVFVYALNTNKAGTPTTQISGTEEVKTFAVSGNEFSFSPSELKLKKGEQVKVVFTNTGKYPHNFVIDELGVKSETINSGATTETTFVANKTGSFAFYCGVGKHRDNGMVGTFIVE